MSAIADRIKTGQNQDEMLRRALERIIQLYTDKSHFVYELLQNAEDAEATCIRFVQYRDRLEVYHDGKPFTFENLQGLCDIGRSDKADNLNQIGEFGVGFKSVFGICETVQLYSEPKHYKGADIGNAQPFAVQICDFTNPVDIAEVPIGEAYTTKFVFPFAVGNSFSGFQTMTELNERLTIKLLNLGVTTLLFMKHLEVIEFEVKTGDRPISGQYMLDKQRINDHCELVHTLSSSPVEQVAGQGDIVSFLKFSRYIDMHSPRTVDIAFPIVVKENEEYEFISSKDPYVSVYFPTETESKLDFIVQGPFRTTPNRSSIPADDRDNQSLAAVAAELLHDSVLELKEAGKLNMSLLKILPLREKDFNTYRLFFPLFNTVRKLFSSMELIPTKSGGYTAARFAKIARQEKLAVTLNDDLLTELIRDGNHYYWLPTFLTETNREYEAVFRFLTNELKIGMIRPEDLRVYFASNPDFLPNRTDDWLVELYSVLENVPAAFSKTRNETNMLTSSIIKTTVGTFVAPYRRADSKQLVPNVFLQSEKIRSKDIHFVDPVLYQRCRHFFDDILQIQKPNEYEFYIKDLNRRYAENYVFDAETHIWDVQALLKCLKSEEYRVEANRIAKDHFMLRCTDGKMRRPTMFRMFFMTSSDGVNIEAYFKNTLIPVCFVDQAYYEANGIKQSDLKMLNVLDSLLIGDEITSGIYEARSRGKQPTWGTTGEFRWKLSLDSIKDVLKYIMGHIGSQDSILKSQIIWQILLKNESKLKGTVLVSGNSGNLRDETCELIKVLRGERHFGWDGKWLYTESLELVSPKAVSKYDISPSIYGTIKSETSLYELLGFKKTEADEVDRIKKGLTSRQLDVLFEEELRQRFGISTDDLISSFGQSSRPSIQQEEVVYPFPVGRVKNYDALRKHAAEIFLYSDPVSYMQVLRSIRVSNKAKEARSYLMSSYRYDGVYRYACQMCHEPSADIEATQIFNNPKHELDPLHLCLCPNCASVYKRLRTNGMSMKGFRQRILAVKEMDIQNGEQVIVPLEDWEIWFTQIHFAELQELLKLSSEVEDASSTKKANEAPKATTRTASEIPTIKPEPEPDKTTEQKWGAEYVGRTIRRKSDGMEGVIQKIDSEYFYVDVVKGKRAGETIKITLKFVLENKVYTIA